MLVKIRVKQRFKVDVYYPECEKARMFTQLMSTKTLPEHALRKIRKLGFTIQIAGYPERKWEPIIDNDPNPYQYI